jgi:hypothetical protein
VGISRVTAGHGRWWAGLRLALPALGLMALSVGLSAFYWLPALTEQELVRISQAFGPAHFNYATNFLDPGELLALPFVVDPRLVQQDVPLSISLIALLLAVYCLATITRTRADPEKMGHILFSALVVVVGLFMALPISEFIWDRLPLLPFVQFPWRFLGLISLFLALLAGAGMASLLSAERLAGEGGVRWLRLSLPALVIGLAALSMLPWSYTDTVVPPPATITGAAEFARQSGALGTTSAGEYFPVAVSQVPVVERPGFPDDDARLKPESLPDGASLLAAEYRPLAYRVAVDSPVPFTAVFNTLFFEGWRATIDGQPAELRATGPEGLIGLEVPAGQYDIEVGFASTAVRDVAAAVSWISLLLLAPALFLLDRGRKSTKTEAPQTGPTSTIVIVILVLLAVSFLRFVYFDRSGSILLKTSFDGGQVAGVDRALNADFERQLLLLAADVPQAMAADQELILDLYWQAPEAVDQEYSTSIVLVDQQGLVVGQSDKQHPGVIPTTRWATDEYARDRHTLRLLPGTPPGEYQVQARVYLYGRPQDRLNVLDESGAPVGQELTVTSLTVGRPESPVDPEEIIAGRRVDWVAGEGLILAGYTIPGGPVQAGEPLFLEMIWQASAATLADQQMVIELVDGQGRVVHTINAPLVEGLPTSAWQAGDIWRSTQAHRLPATIAGGDYGVILRLDQDRPLMLGVISVTAPDHVLTPPDIAFPAEIDFVNVDSGAVAQLVGYDVIQAAVPGEILPVALSWRSLSETPVSYKVFVQLLDEEGRLVTGSDAIPAGWTRPTTGWIAGEYIIDRHELRLPADLTPGSYQLLVGLYDAVSGERLVTAEGRDAYLLPLSVELLKD